MRRTAILIASVLVGAVIAVGWARARLVPSPPAPIAAGERDEEDDDGVPRERGGRDKPDNTPATPPDSAIALIPPTPLDAAPAQPVEPVPVPTTRPNVVLVLGCTVRKDQVTPYGGHPEATPFLAALAGLGTVFDDTIAAAPWTRVASTAILTGRHAINVGMIEPADHRNNRRVPASVELLAEHMSARGYFTLGATANPNLSPEFGFAQGYEVYQPELKTGWSAKLDGKRLANALADALAENRASGDERPFYLRAMMLDAHAPRKARGDKIAPYAEEGVPERVAQYRYHLREFDDGLAQLSRRLKEQGYDESNTVFVVIADHGEGMNYPGHHGYGHGQYLTPSTNHIAWVMGGVGVARGHRVLGLSSQVDLVPTLLGVIGAPLEDPAESDGRDWSDLVRGNGRVTSYDRVWSDTWFGGTTRAAVYTHGVQCQDDFGSSAKQLAKAKFVAGCYDRRTDPLFTQPFQDQPLLDALHAWRAERWEEFSGAESEQVEVNEELNRELEQLGYVE
jgi:arylsulfatase A-like enzyme